jgi:hypothetical protein
MIVFVNDVAQDRVGVVQLQKLTMFGLNLLRILLGPE